MADELEEGTRIHGEVRIVGDSRSTVTLQPRAIETDDQALWVAIQNRTEAINFDHYFDFIDRLLCHGIADPDRGQWSSADDRGPGEAEEKSPSQFGSPPLSKQRDELERRPDIFGVDAYHLLKLATRAFLTFEAGVVIKERKFDGSPDMPDNHRHIDEDRLYRMASIKELEHELHRYLTRGASGDGRALPYLKLIIKNLISLREP